jgi:hypothetical protein
MATTKLHNYGRGISRFRKRGLSAGETGNAEIWVIADGSRVKFGRTRASVAAVSDRLEIAESLLGIMKKSRLDGIKIGE